MYTEEYEHRGFPFRDFLLKLILIIIFVFLLIWLLPKFISPKLVTKTNESAEQVDISSLTSQIFSDNLEKMKDAAISYYTDERLPKEVGDSDQMTLSDMIGKKLIVALIDKNNKACDVDKSYVKITKLDEEYILKVNLKDSEKEDYILVHLGCYTYCDSYICEKKETSIAIKAAKPTSEIPISKPSSNSNPSGSTPTNSPSDNTTPSTQPSDEPTDSPSSDPTDNPTPTPTQKPGYVYEYKKVTGAEFSSWSSWSNWSKTSCSTQAINCSDSSTSCLKKVQLYNRKEQIGTYQKQYSKTRSILKQAGSYTQKSCSKYNYVIVNNTTYATTTTYTTINNISSTTAHTSGSWRYNGRNSYANPPRDTATTHYKFVGADYSYCNDTCTTLPNYYYDSYTYTGDMSAVSSTTTTPNNSSSSSSTSTSVSASCGSYVTKTIPVYVTIETTESATRTEPLYGTVCYQSSKTRKLISAGKTSKKWSKYNDTSLLNNGWYYTGRKKLAS